MRGFLILAVLCQGLFATSPPVCKLYPGQTAADEATYLINKLHHHGYKFKLDSFTEGMTSCLTHLTLTLNETKCHIVNPKPFDECEVREEHKTPVTAKCNVSLCDGGEKPGIAYLSCDTEPASREQLARLCPDCPTLLPLHDPQGLESVKAAIEKFNKESNETSYFKLLEVGRLSSQYNMMFGMSHFAEFAIVETECSDNVKNEEKPACKQKCSNEAHHGFCMSTQLGNGDLTVDCEIYDIQNRTHHSHPPFRRGKHCGHHERHPHHSGHHERGEHESHHGHREQGEHESGRGHRERGEHESGRGHRERGEHESGRGHRERGEHESGRGHRERGEHETRPGHPTHPGQPETPVHTNVRIGLPGNKFCFTRADRGPFHKGPPHHGGPPHPGGPPHHGDHGKHDKDPKIPQSKPLQPPQPTPPGSEENQDFSFPHCHGAVKIPPSIHPICPFPPSFHRRDHH